MMHLILHSPTQLASEILPPALGDVLVAGMSIEVAKRRRLDWKGLESGRFFLSALVWASEKRGMVR